LPDILDQIVEKRRKELDLYGPAFGVTVPERRMRPIVPFLKEKGAILEIKRASPSKGEIASVLDPLMCVRAYSKAGAKNVSVLTERNFLMGP